MQVIGVKTFSGPSVYHNKPLLRMRLDIGHLEQTDSSKLPDFVDRLLKMLPGLGEHRCSEGHPGGFVERLRTGTWMGHIVEHMALEMSDMAGISVGYGKTITTDWPGIYDVYVRFVNESGMRELLLIAVDLADALLAGPEFPIEERLEKAREMASNSALGPSTAALVEAAEKRGIPVRRLNSYSLIQLGYGCKLRRIEAAVSSSTSHLGVEIAGDKHLTRVLLQESALPTPDGESVSDCESAVVSARGFGYPVV